MSFPEIVLLYPLTLVYGGIIIILCATCSDSRHIGWMIAGWLTFSLGEYLNHRFYYHDHNTLPKAWHTDEHVNHHKHPSDPDDIVFTLRETVPVVTMGVVIFLWIHRPPYFNGYAYVVGILLGYLSYEWVHVLAHVQPPNRNAWMDWISVHHQMHHARPHTNYGVSTPLWDIIFSTKDN